MIRLIRSPRALALLAAVLVVCAAAVLAPLPGPARVQEWADSVGPVFPLVFFVVYALVTVAPVPRTVLTVSCGVLFGVGLGLTVALAATTVSAALALLLVRRLDGRRVAARLTHPAVRAVDERLRRRGWLAVWSLRMISFAPFSVVNYCCALSSIRFTPYLVATVLGSLPGTAATVILADALVSGTSPEMIAVSVACLLMGVAGLVLDTRWQPAEPDVAAAESDPVSAGSLPSTAAPLPEPRG
ncbi:TVP38/TMEM64 family protein [Nocardia sp. NPDC057353]|uniref:TVP38/TMEM64 family protein n=1 Tax=Nocardia sp. NPDC057353 TaxID=3346104 RepID=UPI00362572AA